MGKIMVLHPMCEEGDFARELLADQPDIDVVSLDKGPRVIMSAMDYAIAGLDSVKKAREAEKAGYEAIVLTCHGDPNLYPLREAVRIPVLGCTQVALHMCSLLARRFSILVPRELYAKWSKEDAAIRYGLESKIASIRQVSFDAPLDQVGRLSRRRPVPKEIIAPLVKEAIKAIEEDDATAITFGCLFMGMLGDELKRHLKERGFDILVMPTLPIAVDLARFLVRNKLTHSALAFPLAEHCDIRGETAEIAAAINIP